MTTDLLSEDVVLQISPPHIIMAESGGGGAGGAGAGGRGVYSGGVELGRRLLQAARQGNTALVLDLMAKGAPFTTDWLGTSPLHVAAAGGHADTCGVLLRAGVSRDARTKVERTPLHLAAHAGHAHVARLLLEHGARADCRDMLRMTPLHWAAERGCRAVVRVLLRHAADVGALSKFHKSARQLAAARDHRDIVALIDEAAAHRENDKSLEALRDSDEQMEIPAAEQQRALDSIERQQAPAARAPRPAAAPIKIDLDQPAEEGGGGGGGTKAAQLLKKHGITLLPHDDTTTVFNAIQSGRTVVLSDAGKLMLKENSSPSPPAPACPPAASCPPAPAPAVVLSAAPARSPPRPGVKIFTLDNKMLSLPDNKLAAGTLKDVQIKLVNVGRGGGAARGTSKGARRPVKIIMQKANYNKIVGKTNDVTPQTAPAPPGVVCVPQEFLSSTCPAYLRAQLLSAHHTINTLTQQLRALQDSLQRRDAA